MKAFPRRKRRPRRRLPVKRLVLLVAAPVVREAVVRVVAAQEMVLLPWLVRARVAVVEVQPVPRLVDPQHESSAQDAVFGHAFKSGSGEDGKGRLVTCEHKQRGCCHEAQQQFS